MNKYSTTISVLKKTIGVYIFATIIVFLASDRSIFVPQKSSYQDSASIIKLRTHHGKTISAMFFPNPQAKYVVLYSHGNAVDMMMISKFLTILNEWGFAAIAYDYEGYGTSEGYPSEASTYRDIEAVYDYLLTVKHYKPEQIILYGRSLGSGPSVELASRFPVAGVVLEGAFVSTYRVVTYFPLFPFDKFNNISKINQIKAPILFVHGTNDEVVPFWHAEALYNKYAGKKEFLWIQDGLHNDSFYYQAKYKEAFMNFVASLSS